MQTSTLTIQLDSNSFGLPMPPSSIIRTISTPDALPTATLLIYPGLELCWIAYPVAWSCYCNTFCSSVLQPSSIRGLATPWMYLLHLSRSSVILIDSSTESPVHVLMLSIQAVRSLPRLHTWHCSLHYLFFQATPLFPNGVTIVC